MKLRTNWDGLIQLGCTAAELQSVAERLEISPLCDEAMIDTAQACGVVLQHRREVARLRSAAAIAGARSYAPQMHRSVAVHPLPSSCDERGLGDLARVVIASDAPVMRVDAEGQSFDEVLSCEAGAPDLSRVNQGGVPLLWRHDEDAPALGTVLAGWTEAGTVRAVLVWSPAPPGSLAAERRSAFEAGRLWLSAGFDFHPSDLLDQGRRRLIRRWRPLEVSLTPIPADPSCGGLCD